MQDLQAILSLYEILFTEMANLDTERMQPVKHVSEFVENAIKADKFYLLVAEFKGDVKGFCLVQKQSSAPYNCIVQRDFGYIFDLVVSLECGKQNAGQKLFDAMKVWAKDNNLSHLEFSVLLQNYKAIKFYEREGITEITRSMEIKL